MSDVLRALTDALPSSALSGEEAHAQWAVGGAVPQAVVAPSTDQEVQTVLAVAAGHKVGVVPLGSGSSAGCEAPDGPFLVLSTRAMDGVEDYEPADLTVTVRAGTTLGTLDATLQAQGQWLPVDPPFMPRRTVGGLVATGTAGSLGTAYGAPRDHVLGLTVVTGAGQSLRLGGRVMKNVAGFDLVKLLVGSRGTLGVVTSASLRLFPTPATDRVLVLEADDPGDLLEPARAVATAAVVPASASLVTPSPTGKAPSALVVRVQGAPDAVDADTRTLLGGALARATAHEGPAAAELLGAVRDHAAADPVVLRAFALPGLLPATLDAVREAAPHASVLADVMAGRVRAGLGADGTDGPGLLRLRARLEALGGTLVLERATLDVLDEVPAHGAAGSTGSLSSALRRRFDPQGVFSPGRFVW